MYTWLWERAAAMDPAFRPARLSALAQDLDALVAQRPGAKERFTKIRDGRTDRLPWAEYGQMHDWFVENESNIAYAAYFDVDGLWPTQIDNNQFPKSQKLFRELFGR